MVGLVDLHQIRHDPFHSIPIWRLKKEESIRERDNENEEKKTN
jgi:hypothetical protein